MSPVVHSLRYDFETYLITSHHHSWSRHVYPHAKRVLYMCQNLRQQYHWCNTVMPVRWNFTYS